MFILILLSKSLRSCGSAVHLSFVALKSQAGHAQADEGKSDQRLPMAQARFVLARSYHPQRQLGQMIRWQKMGDLLQELGQKHDRNPKPRTKGKRKVNQVDGRHGRVWTDEVSDRQSHRAEGKGTGDEDCEQLRGIR